MKDIILHQWEISPFCGKVRKALNMKGVPFQKQDYNGLRARLASSLSAQGQLPVLEMDGLRISDSSDIVRELDQLYPEPRLIPQDPDAAARVALWEDWADESLYWFEIYFRFTYREALAKAMRLLTEGRPFWERHVMTPIIRRTYTAKARTQGIARRSRGRVEAAFRGHLAMLDRSVAATGFLVGSTPTLADVAVSAQLEEILRTGNRRKDFDAHADLVRWLETMRRW